MPCVRLFGPVAVGLCSTIPLLAQAALPVLNPKTYVSPSGEFSLAVDPSDVYGAGAGRYRLTRGGREVWAETQDFAFWDASVTDTGVAAGFAYTRGYAGEPGKRNYGVVRIAIFEPDGRFRLEDDIPRGPSNVPDDSPRPIVAGVLVNAPADRFVVRISGPLTADALETWRTYELSTGKRLPDMQPARPRDVKVGDVTVAQPVRDTPLVLLQWFPLDDAASAVFSLADAAGHSVWTHQIAGDFAGSAEDSAKPETDWDLVREGTVLSVAAPRRFELRYLRAKKRVTFEVNRAASQHPSCAPERPEASAAWVVKEIARADFVEPPADPLAAIPRIELEHLGTIKLGPPAPIAAIRGVDSFDIDEKGRLAFVRRNEGAPPEFVLVEPNGKIVRAATLPNEWSERDTRLAWLTGARWIVLGNSAEKAAAVFVDAAQGAVHSVGGFACPPAVALDNTKDGGFVVLTRLHERYTIIDELIAFDPVGKVRWRIGGNSEDRQALFSPEDVAVTTAGQVAVLQTIRNNVQIYTADGKYVRTIELAAEWDDTPNYPTAIAADADGGFIIHDFDNQPPIRRCKGNGEIVSRFEPHYADGRKFPLRSCVKWAPDGRLWICDGESLLELKADGVVRSTLGAKPDADELGAVGGLAIDYESRIYAVAKRNMALHVFDHTGRPLRVLKPDPTDFRTNADAHVQVASDGSVYVAVSPLEGGGHVRFTPDGKHTRVESRDGDGGTWFFMPHGGGRWVEGYQQAFLVDAEGDPVCTIKRRPDDSWLEQIECISVAPDGSAAIAADESGPLGVGVGNATVNLYSVSGSPIRTIRLPAKSNVFRVAYMSHLVVSLYDKLLIMNLDGSDQALFVPPGKPRAMAFQPFLPEGRDELWLWPTDEPRIERYALPEAPNSQPAGSQPTPR